MVLHNRVRIALVISLSSLSHYALVVMFSRCFVLTKAILNESYLYLTCL